MRRRDAAADRAEKDRREGRGLDERIAARELALAQLIGKDAVFHRAEQRRQHAEQEERHEQQGGWHASKMPAAASGAPRPSRQA